MRVTFLLALCAVLGACSNQFGNGTSASPPTLTQKQNARPEIVTNQGIAFSRLDEAKQVVAYDTVSAYDDHTTKVADCARFSLVFRGARWCFSSSENQAKFAGASKGVANQYVPFGGGYCARGLSNGNFAAGDPRTHVRAGSDMILNGSWAVSDNFFDDMSARRAAARVMYRMAQQSGLLVPNNLSPK